MKSVITIKVTKKSIKEITKSICKVMKAANNSDRNDETTQAALRALSESASNIISNNVFTVGKR